MPTTDKPFDMSPVADPSPEQSSEQPWTAESETSRATLLIREGDRLLKRIEKQQIRTWEDWLRLAHILATISQIAMRLSGANAREGRGYSEAMSRLLHAHALGDPKWKQVRAALINIHENLDGIEGMRASWSDPERLRWAAPTTVWDRYAKRVKSPPAQTAVREPVVKFPRPAMGDWFDNELDKQKREAAALFAVTDSPRIVATKLLQIVSSQVSHAEVLEIAKALLELAQGGLEEPL